MASPAAAQGQGDAADRCNRPDVTTTDEIATCLQGVQIEADKRLNRTYARALAVIGPVDRAALRDAQRAWLAFRARDRRSLFGAWRADHGTLSRIETAQADILAIDARERQLRVYLPDRGPGR